MIFYGIISLVRKSQSLLLRLISVLYLVREHLYIAARLQNVPEQEIDKRIKTLVYDVGLTEKMNKYSKTLSGGQVGYRYFETFMILFLLYIIIYYYI